MPVTCPNCGGPHPRWECRKPLDHPLDDEGPVLVPKSLLKAYGKLTFQGHELKAIEPIPKPPFDRVAYQKAYMKEYHKKRRAKLKAEKDKAK